MINRVIVPILRHSSLLHPEFSPVVFFVSLTLCFIKINSSGYRHFVLYRHYDSDISIFHNTVQIVLPFLSLGRKSLFKYTINERARLRCCFQFLCHFSILVCHTTRCINNGIEEVMTSEAQQKLNVWMPHSVEVAHC